jgi:uncharacterized Ntn-hydrolase superfamily protein
MAKAFRESKGDFAERLLVALEAAQAEGGDIRGRQSAAIVIVTGKPTGQWYKDRLVDLRVEDSPDPVGELRRLVKINRAYRFMNEGDELLAKKDTAGAVRAYNSAMQMAPDITEIEFWAAVTLFENGQEAKALEYFKQIFAKEPIWMDVVRRLPQADLLKNDSGQLDRILGAANH